MAEYHLYCLDRAGKSVEAQLITAPSDEEAVAQAKALKGLRQCEVWRGDRLIATITKFEA